MRLTLSRAPLSAFCLFHARPEVEAPRVGSSYAEQGNAFDALVPHRDAPPDGWSAKLTEAEAAEVLTWWSVWKDSPFSQLPWRYQVAVALDPIAGTGRIIETTARNYADIPANEIPGTTDLFRVEGTRLFIGDTKTGLQAHTEPAKTNRQLRSYALGGCRALGLDEATIQLFHVTSDGVHVTEAHLDAFDLIEIEQELAAQVRAIPTAEPKPGMHCRERFCPALAVCPATQQALQVISPGEALTVDPAELAKMPDADLERFVARVKAVGQAQEIAEKALKAAADIRGGIHFADGRVWKGWASSVESIDLEGPAGREAEAILAQHGVDGAIRRRSVVSKEDIEQSFREAKKKIAPSVRALMSDLRAIDATKSRDQVRYEARKPKDAA